MSLLITLTFDLTAAQASQYVCIEEVLKKYKLKDSLIGESNKACKLPNNVYAVEVIGKNALAVRDAIVTELEAAFRQCKIQGKYFITVGESWAWAVGDI